MDNITIVTGLWNIKGMDYPKGGLEPLNII